MLLSIFPADIPSEIGYPAAFMSILGGAWVVGSTIRYAYERIAWRNPIIWEYFRPKSHYDFMDFPGAAEDEDYPCGLNIHPGEYYLMFRVRTTREVPLDDCVLSFPGAGARILDHGSGSPFTTSRNGSKGLDWHGREISLHPLPMRLKPEPEMVWVFGHRIEAREPFSGTVQLVFETAGHGVIVLSQPFSIDPEGRDDIPFLRTSVVDPTMQTRISTIVGMASPPSELGRVTSSQITSDI